MSDMAECFEDDHDDKFPYGCSLPSAHPKFSEVAIGDVTLSPSETLILFLLLGEKIKEMRGGMCDKEEMNDDLKSLIAIRFLLVESC